MAKIGPESIAWLDKLPAVATELEKQTPPKYEELAKAFNSSNGMIANLVALYPLFGPVAIARIRQEAAGIPPISFLYAKP